MTVVRDIARRMYGDMIGLSACAGRIANGHVQRHDINVFYGGARGGHRGGPQVKVDLLGRKFPDQICNFNILYLLSGALYLRPLFIKFLKDRDVPVVLNQNGVFYPAWYPDRWQFENDRMARVMALSDHVFYQSEFCKKSADRFVGCAPRSFEILYNGVDTNYFTPRIKRDKDVSKPFLFLITGNIGHSTYYRLNNALDGLACARAQELDVGITFRGVIPEMLRQKLMEDISAKNLQDYFFVGRPYSRDEAPNVFSRADAYLMTKHNDPCPNVVLEALSCGLPVLYSASGGVPELVGDEAGVGLFVPETFEDNPVPAPDVLAQGMAKIIEQHSSFSEAARRRAVEKFDIAIWLDRHRSVFGRLLNDKVGSLS